MSLEEFLASVDQKISGIKDAGAGALVYFLYGQFFQKKTPTKGIVAFIIGTLFAMYVSPEMTKLFNLNPQFTSFITGLLGMRLTESLINQDYQEFFKSLLTKNIKK